MSNTSLADAIQSFQDEIIPTIPTDTLNTMMSELESLVNSGIAEKAAKTGDAFPDFNLPNAKSEFRSLDQLLSTGPLVVSFYRGAWCPYCNLEINALQKSLPEIVAAGGQLVTISPQTPDKSEEQVSTANLTFEVLSDVGNKLASKCGLVFTLPENLRPIYESWQIDIPGSNRDNSYKLPIPATFVINTAGKIHYTFVDMDYTKRLEPSIIIEQLRSL